jgi:hypothetical protein
VVRVILAIAIYLLEVVMLQVRFNQGYTKPFSVVDEIRSGGFLYEDEIASALSRAELQAQFPDLETPKGWADPAPVGRSAILGLDTSNPKILYRSGYKTNKYISHRGFDIPVWKHNGDVPGAEHIPVGDGLVILVRPEFTTPPEGWYENWLLNEWPKKAIARNVPPWSMDSDRESALAEACIQAGFEVELLPTSKLYPAGLTEASKSLLAQA